MVKRYTTRDIQAHKAQTPLVVLTAYTAPMAKILDNHADILLVGDSLGMVLYGYESTLPVTLNMMITHTEAIVRASTRAFIVADLPFGTYQAGPESAFKNAARLMQKTGCQAVKLEGGKEMAETIAFLSQRGIPVIGHVGLRPQSVHTAGGYRTMGKNDTEYQSILSDAVAVAAAGAVAMVIEGVTAPLAEAITHTVSIPTIGIGASPACDGQVLVTEDMLGLFGDNVPGFVRQYAALKQNITQAVKNFASDVREKRFPDKAECHDPGASIHSLTKNAG